MHAFRLNVCGALLCGISFLFSASASHGAAGDVLWTNQLDVANGTDRALAVATRGTRVFVAGRVVNGNADADWLVNAYDAKTGGVLWTNQFDLNGGRDEAFAVATAGQIVAVAGRVRSATSNDNWLVSAYDVKTGSALWQDQYDQSAGSDRANALTFCGKTIIAVGRVTNVAGDFDWFVRAYEAATGTQLWEDQYNAAIGDDEAVAVAGRGSKVFVGGHVTNGAGDQDWLVRGYDVKTGSILWSNQLDVAAGDEAASSVALRGSSVFVAGYVVNGNADEDWKIRAYNAKTGAVLWEDQYDLANDDDRAVNVAVRGRTVAVAGSVRNLTGDSDFAVRTYDGANGSLLWQDRTNPAGGNDAALATTVTGSGVLAVGRVTNSNGDTDWFVQAYALKSGAVLWSNQYDQSSGDDAAVAVAASGSRAFVVGDSLKLAGDADWLVRAYSLK